MNIDPERALHRANAKFVRRFNAVEAALDYNWDRRDFSELSAAWNAVKRAEKAQQAAAAGG
ncbi:hypothetical protein N9L14_03265 [Alphaproteobacteria bacterium]|nr:hypothetical protein [Alphaproteobacteria bacterium]